MDPVSHVILASSINRTRRSLQPGRAISFAIVLGALSPDIDLVLMPTGWDRYLVAHQAGTHSLIGALVCGAFAAALVWLLSRTHSYRTLCVASVIGSLSHVIADLISAGTIRIAWPLLDTPVSNLGVVAFGDAYAVALLALGALMMWRWRTRRAECAVALLIAFALFVAVKTASRVRAEASYRAQGGNGDYRVEPIWASLSDWRIIDASPDRVRAINVNASGAVAVEGEVRRETGDARAIAASREWEVVRNLLRSHEFTFAIAQRQADGVTHVVWSDLRYCPPRVVLPSDCAVSVGGAIDAAGRVARQTIRIGALVQTR